MTRYTLHHLDISALVERRPYKSGSTGRKQRIQRIREEHGPQLIEQYERAFSEARRNRPTIDDGAPSVREVVLEFELSPKADPAKLSRKSEGTRQGAVTLDLNGSQRVALMVPDDKRDILVRLLEEYTTGDLVGRDDKNKRPKNAKRIEEINHIRQATFETFWCDDPKVIPDNQNTKMWWALWCFRDRASQVIETARRLRCRVAEPDNYLHFPDTFVVPVYGPRRAVEILLFGTLGIAEIRRATDSPTFFMDEIRGDEHEWIGDLAERVTWPPNDTPTVCILDTGLNRAHPLLEPAVGEDATDAVDPAWGADDHHGHGTGLAGVSLHGDLTAALGDGGLRDLKHRAESVKILPPSGFNPNQPNSYGPIIQAAVSIAEINNQSAPFRAFCLAITNRNRTGAEATAWSAAIDQSAAGAMVGDEDRGVPGRLFVISAGNIRDDEAIGALSDSDAFPAEDPSQAWNAITAGGYTDKSEIHDIGYGSYSAWAGPGEPSPYSRSSYLWQTRKSPFKPDLVFESGNRALSAARTEAVAGLPSLSLLSTGADISRAPLEPFWATSAAAAQGVRMAAQIAAANPNYWPETVRALMVHSAAWTEPMLARFNETRTAAERADLVRRFGYGVPNLDRALASAKNHLAILAQRVIQPFRLEGSTGKFNEAHLYSLPWPTQALRDLGEVPIQVKVTLSYFVEPNPSFASAIDPFRYQSFGLRFYLKRSLETRTDFLKRRNFQERLSIEDRPATISDSGWLFGEKKISAGSLHCDIWRGTAAELSTRDMLWIHPVSGWWRERKSLQKFNNRSRYALVLTLETEDQNIDLYAQIASLIRTPIEVRIEG